MKRSVSGSQIVCWVGAGLDAIVAALLTWPKFGMWIYGLDATAVTPLAESISSTAAALMWGWTVLLLWASFKRSARRDVLIITILPVAGLFYNTLLDYKQRGLRGDLGTWLMMILESLVIIMLLYGVWRTWREAKAPAAPKTEPAAPAPVAPTPAAPPAQPIQPVTPVAPITPVAQSDDAAGGATDQS